MVRLVTIAARLAASEPHKALTPPPPGTGSFEADAAVN